ncbi:MAG TPA: ATP-dependent DNA helicase RecG [Chitinophagales bacterium]|nr:ATP-dependent DNA helicase RecG [Chitinophagales bacterium]
MSTQDKYAFLQTSIEYLKGVGPERAAILKTEANIHTFGDLLKLFPYRYIDRTQFYSTQHIDNSNTFIQLKGKIKEMREVGEGRGKRLSAIFYDQEGEVELVWFKGIKWIKDGIKPNEIYVLFGKPAWFNGRYNIAHPELELLSNYTSEALGGFKALYNTSEKMKNKGLDSKGIAKLIGTLFLQLKPENIHENIPEYVLKHYHLISRFEAYKQIHIPQNIDDQNNATKRLKFEELLFIQLNLLKNKVIRKKEKGILFEKIDTYFNNFYNNNLPFDLTNAQKRVLKEIRKDTLSGLQMNRLLQGDVGSGKTIIALLSMLMAFDNNYQAALMAPTEILAQQHFQNIQEVLNGMDVKIELLTGSTKTKQRKIILEQLKNGELNGIIGTHALIEDQVIFKNLGLAVVDEQHRFGVEQRAKLWKKNTIVPHILVMTATPIPRTLAMTLYGDLDVSVIDELPPGRKAIKTVHRYESHRIAVFEFMRDEIKKGRQIYIVYPLIAESEKLDLIDLTNGYESICRAFPMPEYHVSIVHGKMKPDDKNFEMDRFVKGITQIMVATTVIEVGVNVPNASVMIIENADRFGLSQLHQLRGRVGRGAEQSFCILMTDFKLSSDAKTRINTMVETNDGFKIAEVDLKLRGPGNIEGTQQSGTLDLRIANLATDGIILEEARKVAMNILEQDENLELPEHYPLKVFIQQKRQYNWSNIS